MTELINDLKSVPDIVTGLAFGIAEAQRRMNADYMQSVERILEQARVMLSDPKITDPAMRTEVLKMLLALLPSRYQFTETTLQVRLDLAQSLAVGVQAGVSIGVPAVAVNAAVSVGYSQDYRAAAEITTVLHAIANDPNTLGTLLTRAGSLQKLPTNTQVPQPGTGETALWDSAGRIFDRMKTASVQPAAPAPAPVAPGPAPAPLPPGTQPQ